VRRRNAPIDTDLLSAQIEAAPGLGRLRALSRAAAQADADTVNSVLREAARFCHDVLVPLNEQCDREGCKLVDGRVKLSRAHAQAWRAYVAAGWPTLDHSAEIGGQGLPLFLATAVQQCVDASCAAFGMLPVLQRSAARLIAVHGSPALKKEWLPSLVTGEWAATICISEADAGSDAARLRTRAVQDGEGVWRIHGEKTWISFGDHDLTPRIGHCLLARTPVGLSLFLAPSDIDGVRNAIVVRRLEEKMGLHGSPTCALGFEGARADLIGTEGRGLQHLFVMITNMRLAAGVQGLGLAAAATDLATIYAGERCQGGPLSAPPVPIATHPDVQRMLLDMTARVEMVRGLALAVAVQVELASAEVEPQRQEATAALVQWLLPIFKTMAGECGFDVSSAALQILGGAGYTREWPIEQFVRDARVATIFEGTTGIQALDLVHRRLWRDGGAGLKAFLEAARADGEACPDPVRASAEHAFALLEKAALRLAEWKDQPRDAEAGATAFLDLAGLAATGWIALRLIARGDDTPASRRLSSAGRYWLSNLPERADLAYAESTRGAARLDGFAEITGACVMINMLRTCDTLSRPSPETDA
jgi:3-(methylthio)propanoyl-CoA dehydrogenase